MNEVYHAVRLGKKLNPAWYDWQDDLGLTILHYAILLKKEELVADLLDKREWFSQTSMIDSRAMDYIVLAKLMGLSNCDLILQKTSEPLVTLQRSQKAMKRQLWLRERQLDYQQAVIRSAKQTIHQARYAPPDEKPDIDLAEYEEKYERCLDQMHETKERIRALKESIPEIEAGIIRYGTDDKITIYVWNCPETECCFNTADDALEYMVGSDRLRDVITQVTVLDRSI